MSPSCYFSLHYRPPSHGDLQPPGSFGKASLGQSPHVACLPPEGTQSCGLPFLSPTHPTQDHPRVPLPAQLGLGTSYSRPGLPSINSRLHTHVFLPLGTCMGRAVPRTCALERGPLFSLGFGASRLLEFVLCSGDSIDPRGPSPLPEHWGLEWQLLGSRRGKETPETQRDPFLSWEWVASCPEGPGVEVDPRACPQSPAPAWL